MMMQKPLTSDCTPHDRDCIGNEDLVGAGGERASDAGEGGGGVDAVIGDGERAVDV